MSEEAQNAKDALLEPVKSAIQARLSPFVVSFVVSWCLWNWEFLAMIIWGGGDVPWRISFAKEHYRTDGSQLAFPFISALFIQPVATVCGHLASIYTQLGDSLLLWSRRWLETKTLRSKLKHENALKGIEADNSFTGSPLEKELSSRIITLLEELHAKESEVATTSAQLSEARKLIGTSISFFPVFDNLLSKENAIISQMTDKDLARWRKHTEKLDAWYFGPDATTAPKAT